MLHTLSSNFQTCLRSENSEVDLQPFVMANPIHLFHISLLAKHCLASNYLFLKCFTMFIASHNTSDLKKHAHASPCICYCANHQASIQFCSAFPFNLLTTLQPSFRTVFSNPFTISPPWVSSSIPYLYYHLILEPNMSPFPPFLLFCPVLHLLMSPRICSWTSCCFHKLKTDMQISVYS